VAAARLHMPPRRRMLRLRLPVWRHLALRRRMPWLPLPVWRHLVLRHRMARVPGLGWPRLTLLRHVSCHLLLASHPNGLASLHHMRPPKSQPLASLRRSRVRLAQWNERGRTPLHLHPRREEASAATNRPAGKPLAIRSLARVPGRVKLARSGKFRFPRVATEMEMQIGR
jgi:hypothetical protein